MGDSVSKYGLDSSWGMAPDIDLWPLHAYATAQSDTCSHIDMWAHVHTQEKPFQNQKMTASIIYNRQARPRYNVPTLLWECRLSTWQNLESHEKSGPLGMPVQLYLVCVNGRVKSCPLWVAPMPPGMLDCLSGERELSSSTDSPLSAYQLWMSWDQLPQASPPSCNLELWA